MRPTMETMILAAAVASMAACDRADTASNGAPASATSAAVSPVPSAIKIVADENGFTPSTVSAANRRLHHSFPPAVASWSLPRATSDHPRPRVAWTRVP
jgi:hypothetical protein